MRRRCCSGRRTARRRTRGRRFRRWRSGAPGRRSSGRPSAVRCDRARAPGRGAIRGAGRAPAAGSCSCCAGRRRKLGSSFARAPRIGAAEVRRVGIAGQREHGGQGQEEKGVDHDCAPASIRRRARSTSSSCRWAMPLAPARRSKSHLLRAATTTPAASRGPISHWKVSAHQSRDSPKASSVRPAKRSQRTLRMSASVGLWAGMGTTANPAAGSMALGEGLRCRAARQELRA